MQWNNEERHKIVVAKHHALGSTGEDPDLAVASETVKLVAARGGTLTAERLDARLEHVGRAAGPLAKSELSEHVTAQGATVATIQARVAELEGELTGLRAAFDDEQGIARRALNERDTLQAKAAELERSAEGWKKTALRNAEEARSARSDAESVLARLQGLRQAIDEAVKRWGG